MATTHDRDALLELEWHRVRMVPGAPEPAAAPRPAAATPLLIRQRLLEDEARLLRAELGDNGSSGHRLAEFHVRSELVVRHWAPGFAAFCTVELPPPVQPPGGAHDSAKLDRRIAQLGFIARRVAAGHERI